MDLIDDVYLVFPNTRWDPHLLIESAYVLYSIVRSSVQFEDIERIIVILILDGVLIDLAGKYACTGGLTYSSGTAEQECLSKMIVLDLIVQSRSHMTLSNHLFKGRWSVLTGRNDVFAHRHKKSKNLNGNGVC